MNDVLKDFDTIWKDFTQMPRANKLVPFPRNKPQTQEEKENGDLPEPYGWFSIVELTAEENATCVENAAKEAEKRVGADNPQYKQLFKELLAKETLFKCVRKPDELDSLVFPHKDAVFKTFTPTEIDVLVSHYNDLVLYDGALLGELDESKMKALIKRLQDSGSNHFFLNSTPQFNLKKLVLFLVDQLSSLQTNNSLLGEQLNYTSKTSKKRSKKSKKKLQNKKK